MTNELITNNSQGFSKSVAIGITAFNIVVFAGMIYVLKHKKQNATNAKEVNYVFFSTGGKPIVLSEQKVYEIRQMHEDGVLPTAIAEQYNMSPVMLCRIINFIKSL